MNRKSTITQGEYTYFNKKKKQRKCYWNFILLKRINETKKNAGCRWRAADTCGQITVTKVEYNGRKITTNNVKSNNLDNVKGKRYKSDICRCIMQDETV